MGKLVLFFIQSKFLDYPQKFADDFCVKLVLIGKMKTKLNSNYLSLFQDNIHFKGNILLEIYKTNSFTYFRLFIFYENQSAQKTTASKPGHV